MSALPDIDISIGLFETAISPEAGTMTIESAISAIRIF
jgi:hypothetical protein